MANAFDRFDAVEPSVPSSVSGNAFDRFDEPVAAPLARNEPQAGALNKAPQKPALNDSERDPDSPGLISNSLRNAGERGFDLLGNAIQFIGNAAEKGERAITESLDGFSPGLVIDKSDALRGKGYEPDLEIGGYGIDFTSRVKPEDTDTGLRAAGQAVQDIGLGYEPKYTIDQALDEPTLRNLAGAVAEQGPAALADMAALIVSTPVYLASRTQEIGEARVKNDGGDIRNASPELQKAIVENFANGTEIPEAQQREADELAENGGMPELKEYLVAGPTAAASVLLDRFALGKLLPGGGKAITSARQVPGAIGRATVTEAGTEAMQEGVIEYAGESVGTEAGWNPNQAIRRAAGGALVGGPTGGVVRGGTATYEVAANSQRQAQGRTESVGEGVRMDAEPGQEGINATLGQTYGFNLFDQFDQPTEASVNAAEQEVEPPVVGVPAGQQDTNGDGSPLEEPEVSAPIDQAEITPEQDAVEVDLQESPTPVEPKPPLQAEQKPPIDALTSEPDADQMPKEISTGLGTIKVKPLNGRMYRETSPEGVGDLIRETLSNSPERGAVRDLFVTDDPDLAIGQGRNKGAMIEFDGEYLSGREHQKPGAGVVGGKEYRADYVNRNAIRRFTLPEGARLKGAARVFASKHFDRTKMDDGSTEYTRKTQSESDRQSVVRRARAQMSTTLAAGDQQFDNAAVQSEASSASAVQADAGPANIQEDAELAPNPAERVDQAAAETNINPTDAQKEAGNYRKSKVRIQGLEIAIENPRGSTRSGTDPDGNRWESTMAHHYGDIKGTAAADGDNLDAFIGPDPDIDQVFVVDQPNADGSFDEHKILLGFKNEKAAKEGYLANYDKGWKVGPITRMSTDELKAWIRDGDTTKPLAESRVNQEPEPTDTAPSQESEAEFVQAGQVNQVASKQAEPTEDMRFSRKAQTQTGAFKRWFGDSKVVGENGEPLVVYHGTTGDFSTFDPQAETSTGANSAKLGFFFANDRQVAESYANHSATFAPVKRLLDEADQAEQRGDWDTYDAKIVEAEELEGSLNDISNRQRGQNVMPVYLSIRNPMEIDAKGEMFSAIEEGITSQIRRAKAKGHDGVIIRNLDDSAGIADLVADHYVAFKPNQIKSATGNSGAFSADTGDIRFGREGDYLRDTRTQPNGLSAPEAKALADTLMQDWKGRPDITIADSLSELPKLLRDAIREAGAESDMRAVYLDGHVYVLAPRIPNEQALQEVILHEVIGHYGLRKMLGGDIKPLLNQVWLSQGGKTRSKGIINTYFPDGSFDVSNADHRHTVAEELIAHMAEKGANQKLLARIVAAIREGLRKLGFTIGVSENDIVRLLRGARRTVEQGGISRSSGADLNFSRVLRDLSGAQLTENGDASRLINPVYLQDGSRLSGFTDPAEQTTFYGYDQNGEQFTIRRSEVRPDEIASSRDRNRTADAIKEGLLSLQAVSSDPRGNRGSEGELANGNRVPDEPTVDEVSGSSTDGVIPPGFRFSRVGIPDLDPQPFGPPSDTLIRRLVSKIADKHTVLKGVQQNIRDQFGEIPEPANAYRAEELFHGKVENDIRLIQENMVEPLAKSMSENDVSLKQLDEFLYALHAPERNAVIAERNPEIPEGGSGMTDAEAAAVIAKVEKEGKLKEYKALAKRVHDMLEMRRKILKNAGLEDAETIGAWEASYKSYVPLKGWATDEQQPGMPRAGKGFAIAGKESQMAAGRKSRAASPVANSISDLSEAVLRRRKNEVGKSFMELVQAYPNDGYWHVYTDENPEVERKAVRVKDPTTGKMKVEVREQTIPMAMMGDRYFTTKVEGKTHYIKIEDQRLMNAMRNIGPDNSNLLIRSLAAVTRVMSSLNTSYNPEFVISNFSRDIQTALLNLTSEQSSEDGKARGKKIAAKTLKNVGTSIRAINASLRGKKLTGKAGKWQEHFDQFRKDGAKTGWFDMKDIDGQMRDLEKMIGIAGGGPVNGLRRAFKATADWVENTNSAIENGVRLSAYVNAIDAGIPRAKAASLAKNMTVNFNRKGEWGTIMNALFMFANASVQGTANFVRTLGRLNGVKGDPTWSRLNTAQKIAAGMAIGGFALSMLNRMVAGEDEDEVNWWDKVPDYIKERNIVIMKSLVGGEPGEYWTIPLPYGYNIFPVVGTSMEHMAFSDKSAGDIAGNVVLAALGSFSPIGLEESKEVYGVLAKNIMPTILRPVASISLNENFMGGPIFKENFPFGTQKPDSALHFRSTPEAFKVLAEGMNDVTGGSEFRSGAVDLSPDVMQFLVGYYGGGAYDFFTSRTPNLAVKWASGVDLEDREVPFWRKLHGKVLPYEDQSIFYDRRNEINQLASERENLRGAERIEFIKDYRGKLRLQGIMKSTEDRLKMLRKQRDRVEAMDLSAAKEDEKLQRVEKQMKRAIDQFNKRYNEAED